MTKKEVNICDICNEELAKSKCELCNRDVGSNCEEPISLAIEENEIIEFNGCHNCAAAMTLIKFEKKDMPKEVLEPLIAWLKDLMTLEGLRDKKLEKKPAVAGLSHMFSNVYQTTPGARRFRKQYNNYMKSALSPKKRSWFSRSSQGI